MGGTPLYMRDRQQALQKEVKMSTTLQSRRRVLSCLHRSRGQEHLDQTPANEDADQGGDASRDAWVCTCSVTLYTALSSLCIGTILAVVLLPQLQHSFQRGLLDFA